MSVKSKSIQALFVILVIILAVKPVLINNVYNTILGRLLLVGLVIYMSMNNVTMGLLFALAIISVSNQFNPFVEGMENSVTIGDDSAVKKGSKVVLTKDASKKLLTPEQEETLDKRLSTLKSNASASGVDIEAIKTAIMSKDSKAIPIDPSTKESIEVSAFTTGMLGRSSLGGSLTQTTGRMDGSWIGSPSGIKMGEPSKGPLGQPIENSDIGWFKRVTNDVLGRPLGGSGNRGYFT